MKITREWLVAHQTTHGSWTQAQILALGINWPPRRGWIWRLIDTEISPEKAAEFMAGKNVLSVKTLKRRHAQRVEIEQATAEMFPGHVGEA